jgi:hypothetical protein
LVDKIKFLILLLSGTLIGFNVFLTFILAPTLFSRFDTRLAGEVMNSIFPYYFASGWIIGLVIYSLIALLSLKDKNIINHLKFPIIALSIVIISYMALHKTVFPLGQATINKYYALKDAGEDKKAEEQKNRFKNIHMISSTLNIINLLFIVFFMYSVYNNKREEKNNKEF